MINYDFMFDDKIENYQEVLQELRSGKAQLIDIAKVIPSLAVNSLPGGMVMLGILIKVLPFNLLPSAFANDENNDGNDLSKVS